MAPAGTNRGSGGVVTLSESAVPNAVEFSVIGRGPFRQLWLRRACLITGGQILGLALGWQVYDLTRAPFDLGLIGLAQFVPAFFLALPAGHAADRYERRTILRFSAFSYTLVAALLLLGTVTGTIAVWQIFVLSVLLGATRAFEFPAGFAYVSGLIPREHMSRAVAWNQSVMQTATLAGPLLGDALYTLGAGFTYGACAAFFVLGSLLSLTLPPVAQTVFREPPSLRSVFAGLDFIWRNKPIFGVLSLDLFAVLLGGATALMPIYARDILDTDPIGLGLLRTAPAVGALVVAAMLSRFPLRRHAGFAILAGVGVFGLATCVFALSTDIALSLMALTVMGGSDGISVFIRTSLVQLRTPDEMRGRVSSVNSIFIGTSNQLGDFESGATAALFGTVPAALIGGIGTMLVVVIWVYLFPSLRQIDRVETG